MRVFVASFVQASSARRVAGCLPEVAGMRPVPRENLHVTLLFLGSVPGSRRQDVLELVQMLEGLPLSARVSEVTGYPNAQRARTVIARLTEMPILEHWHKQLLEGWSGDEPGRGYEPHITLGRSREGVTVPDIAQLQGMEIELGAPAAYRSETLPAGARYARL